MANLRFFDALPHAGKRKKVAKAIFKVAPPASQARTFVDAFMAGGAVSLMAKALGYRVLGNAVDRQSFVAGKALVENNRVKLTEADMNRLFHEVENDEFVQANFCPQDFLSKHAAFLDNALAVVRAMDDGPKKYLSLLLLVKFISYIRPNSKTSIQNAFNIPMEERRIEWIKNRTYHASIRAALRPIPEVLRGLVHAINAGVIDNADGNQVFSLDALDFLYQAKADVAYFDQMVLDHEEEDHVIGQILAHVLATKKSVDSRKNDLGFLDETFRAAGHIPVWIMSTEANDLAELQQMISRYRRTETYRIKYRHISKASASDHENQSKNEVYLIVGRPY